MITKRSRRSILPAIATVCALLLASSPAAALPPALDFGGWLRGVLTSLWAEHGCAADPDGRCGTAPAAAEHGCAVDPNGRCGAATSAEN